jgi:hypothetical protein
MFVVITSATNVYDGSIVNALQSMEDFAKHFDGEDAVVGGAAATMHSKELAAEIGGLDTVDLNEKREGHVVRKEL